MVRNKFSVKKVEEFYVSQILQKFTNDLPKSVEECHRVVPMEIAMSTLLVTSLTGTSIQFGIEELSFRHWYEDERALPSAHFIRQTLNAWPHRTIISRYRKVIVEQIKRLKHSSFFKNSHKEGVTIAFDITEVGYFGPQDQYTVFSKGRTVASRCHAYLSMQIVCPGFRLILDVEPVFESNKPISKLMLKMLKRMRKLNLKFKHIYLDRGFYQVDVLAELRKHYKHELLMPAIRTSRVKKAIAEWHEKNGFKAGMLELELGKGKNVQPYILVFSPLDSEKRKRLRRKKKDAKIHDFYLFFCLLKAPEQSSVDTMDEVFKRLSYDYRNRWGIETGYRVAKTIWGKTTSRDYTLRLWLMWNAMMLYNLWVLENLDLIEKKGIPESYNCCDFTSLEEIKQAEQERQKKKYPGWARATRTRPVRPWRPRSMEKLVNFNRVLERVAVNQLRIIISSGYTPPPEPAEDMMEN